jgi:hypothetical protein
MARAAAASGHKQGKKTGSARSEERRFGEVLRDELIERGITTGMGNPNWAAFAEMMDGVHYETLRKAVVGERVPNVPLMAEAARVLDIDPDVFPEYRLYEFQRQFDPREVGLEEALANLHAFSATAAKRTRR